MFRAIAILLFSTVYAIELKSKAKTTDMKDYMDCMSECNPDDEALQMMTCKKECWRKLYE